MGASPSAWCTQVEPIIEKFVEFHKVLIPVRAAATRAGPAVRGLATLTPPAVKFCPLCREGRTSRT